MVANILVAHGMGKEDQNKTLGEFIDSLLQDETYACKLAFIGSEEKSVENTIINLIEKGETQFKVVPLLIFSAMYYIIDIPEMLRNIKQAHSNITCEINVSLGTHPYIVDLVEQRINDADIKEESDVAVVLIAHGSFSYTKAHDELKEFSTKLKQDKPIYCRTLYGDITFKSDSNQLSRQYHHLIMVPMFLCDGRSVSKVKGLISEMDIANELHMTPSINFDPILKSIIQERLKELAV